MGVGKVEVATENEEATEAWSGVLFDTFVEYRDLVTAGLGHHGTEAMRIHPPNPGDAVLDLGCGFGDASQQLAELVGPEGEVLGVDVSAPFVEASREDASAKGVENASFEVCDVQVTEFEQRFDYAFSRFGVMFFANPVVALRNIRGGLRPGGRYVGVVWRRKLDNDWLHRAETVVDGYLEEPEDSDVPTCGPGPFSMANADTVSEQLLAAGFDDVSLRRYDEPIKIGDDLDHAVRFNMSLGPAGEVLRMVGDDADEVRPTIERDLHKALGDFVRPSGDVWAPASTWIIGATAP